MTKEPSIYTGDKLVSSVNGVGEIGEPHAKRMKLDHYPIPYTKTYSKQIKYLNLRPEIIKILEENLSGILLDNSLGNDFLNLTLKAKAAKAKINK